MKKANYISYLSEYQGKMPLEVEKTFKHAQKTHKPKLLRAKQDLRKKGQSLHTNQPDINPIKPLDIKSNKQNLHPNIPSEYHPFANLPTKSPRQQQIFSSIYNKTSIQPFSQISPQGNNRSNGLKQVSVSLNRCNLQPSHQSSKLYLVQMKGDKMQLIVCQECSRQFSDKVRLSEFRSSRGNNSKEQTPQYKLYVDHKIQLQQQNQKLNAINSIQSYNLNLTINKIRSYYNGIIRSIESMRCQLQESVIWVYRSNVQHLQKLQKRNIDQIKWLEKEIQNLEERCKSQKNLRNIQKLKQNPLSIDSIGEDNIRRQVELSLMDSNIGSGLVEEFKGWFRQSKFCVQLSVKPNTPIDPSVQVGYLRSIILEQLQNEEGSEHMSQYYQHYQPQQQEQIQQKQQIHLKQTELEQIQQFQQSHQTSPHPSTINLKQLLPFTVSFPTTQSKVMEVEDNFSHRLSPQLNKVQSEELLISSLRGDQTDGDGWGKNNQRTEPSTWRQPQSNGLDQLSGKDNKLINKQQKVDISMRNSPKGNFIKQLHRISMQQIQESLINQGLGTHNEGFSDLLCNEELTIYQNPLVRLSKKPLGYIDRKGYRTGSVEYLENSQNRSQRSDIQQQKNPITQNSLIIANQNKHQISFEIDQNLIIDNDILPIEQSQPQNLDIISPAFKII